MCFGKKTVIMGLAIFYNTQLSQLAFLKITLYDTEITNT